MVEILVNGEPRKVAEGRTVLDLLEDLDIPRDRVAVELDRGILRKERWETTRLQGGEQLEIVHFVGGG